MDIRESYNVKGFYPKFLAHLNGNSGNHNTFIDSSSLRQSTVAESSNRRGIDV